MLAVRAGLSIQQKAITPTTAAIPDPAPDARAVASQVADNDWREVMEDQGQENDWHRRLERAPVGHAVQQRVRQRGLAGPRTQDDREQGQKHRGQALQEGVRGGGVW